jgi:hypothetical protein
MKLRRAVDDMVPRHCNEAWSGPGWMIVEIAAIALPFGLAVTFAFGWIA